MPSSRVESDLQVVTVRGSIAPDELDITLSHDHMIVDAFALFGDATGNCGWILDDDAVAAHELDLSRTAGDGAFVEPTYQGIGRDPAALRRTSCPILISTPRFGELPREQLDLLAREGVDARRVIVSHLGDRIGINTLVPIAERRAWLSVDKLGFPGGYAPLGVRADNVAALCAVDFDSQVMLSNDIDVVDELVTHGGCGHSDVMASFPLFLRARGVPDERTRTMPVANLARAFAYDAEATRRTYLAGPPDPHA